MPKSPCNNSALDTGEKRLDWLIMLVGVVNNSIINTGIENIMERGYVQYPIISIHLAHEIN